MSGWAAQLNTFQVHASSARPARRARIAVGLRDRSQLGLGPRSLVPDRCAAYFLDQIDAHRRRAVAERAAHEGQHRRDLLIGEHAERRHHGLAFLALHDDAGHDAGPARDERRAGQRGRQALAAAAVGLMAGEAEITSSATSRRCTTGMPTALAFEGGVSVAGSGITTAIMSNNA